MNLSKYSRMSFMLVVLLLALNLQQSIKWIIPGWVLVLPPAIN